MKKTFFSIPLALSIALVVLNFTSCNKEEESPQELITGKWTVSDVTLDTSIGGKTLTEYFIETLGLTGAEAAQFAILFDAALQESFSGTVEIKPDQTYIAKVGGDTTAGTWELSADGKKFTMDPGTADEAIFDVVSLSKSLLHLNFNESQMEDINEDSIPEMISMEVDMTLTK